MGRKKRTRDVQLTGFRFTLDGDYYDQYYEQPFNIPDSRRLRKIFTKNGKKVPESDFESAKARWLALQQQASQPEQPEQPE